MVNVFMGAALGDDMLVVMGMDRGDKERSS